MSMGTEDVESSEPQVSIIKNFKDLLINEKIKFSLNEMKMFEMTPIQARCIPHLLDGNDLLGAAKTGSGKTLAFLIPLVEKILKSGLKPDQGTVAIIMSPTRELSIQTFKVLQKLISGTNIRVGVIIGGSSRDQEALYLKQGISILVATPGRLLDHLNNTKPFDYTKLHTLIIDEADRLMNQGFMEEMKSIIKKLPSKRQTVLFSATLNVNSGKLKNKMKKLDQNNKAKKLSTEEKVLTLACISLRESCVCVDMSTHELPGAMTSDSLSCTVSQLTQNYVVCEAEDRFRLLCTLMKRSKGKKIMVFMATCLEVKFYHLLLKRIKSIILSDVPLLSLQGKQKQNKREENFDRFIKEDHAVLLCTDVAARGLDIPHVDMVVQFDPPEDHKEYIHRVGRTARAGKAGQALIFLRSHETEFIAMLQKEKIPVTGLEFDKKNILPIQESLEKIVNTYDAINKTAKDAYKTVVSAYISNPNNCFNIDKLDLKALGKNFGLTELPPMVIKYNKPEKNKTKKRQVGMNSDDDNYYIPSSKSSKQH